MNRYIYINNWIKPPMIEKQLLSWSTWSEVCDFIPKKYFNRGCYVDASGVPMDMPGGNAMRISSTNDIPQIGVLINYKDDVKLIKGGEYIYKCNDEIFFQ